MLNSLFRWWRILFDRWRFVWSNWFGSWLNLFGFRFFIGSKILNNIFLFFFNILTHWRFSSSCLHLQWLVNTWSKTFMLNLITQLYIDWLIRTDLLRSIILSSLFLTRVFFRFLYLRECLISCQVLVLKQEHHQVKCLIGHYVTGKDK